MTHGDDFVATGSKESQLELKKQLESVYPIKASIIGCRFDKRHQSVESENMLGRDRDIGISTTSRHVDVLVESLGLENGDHGANSNN